MGVWGIKSIESDDGLDKLLVITRVNFEKKGFLDFDILEIMETLKKHVANKVTNKLMQCTEKEKEFYFNEIFPYQYADDVLLVTECLAEYIENGKFVFHTYREYEPIKRKTTIFIYELNSLKNLLAGLHAVIDNQKKNLDYSTEQLYRKWLLPIEKSYRAIDNGLIKLA